MRNRSGTRATHGGRYAGAGAILTCLACIWFAGCDGVQGPDLPPLHDIAYNDVLSVPAAGDSVLLAVSTGWLVHPYRDVRVFVDTQASADAYVRLDLRIIGRAASADRRAVVDHRWAGDTLFVWCNEQAAMTWDYRFGAEKTTPELSYLVADRIDVSVPGGVGFRYLGRWWPNPED